MPFTHENCRSTRAGGPQMVRTLQRFRPRVKNSLQMPNDRLLPWMASLAPGILHYKNLAVTLFAAQIWIL